MLSQIKSVSLSAIGDPRGGIVCGIRQVKASYDREGPATRSRGPCSQSEVSWELACRVPCTASCQRVEHLQIKPGIIAFRAIRYVKNKRTFHSVIPIKSRVTWRDNSKVSVKSLCACVIRNLYMFSS